MNVARFGSLADRMSDLDPEDCRQLQQVRVEIVELKLMLEKIHQRELADFLGAADLMVRSLSILEGETFTHGRDLVRNVLSLVASAVSGLGVGIQTPYCPISTSPVSTISSLAERIESHLPPKSKPLVLAGEVEPSPSNLNHARGELLLGQLLIEEGKLTRPHLIEALKQQKVEGLRIGESLVKLGYVSAADVQASLELQKELIENQEGGPETRGARLLHNLSLGEILLRLGGVTEEDIERGMQVKHATGKRLGEALVELGIVTWDRVEEAARIQDSGRTQHAWESERGQSSRRRA